MLEDFKRRVNKHSYASDSKASPSANREVLPVASTTTPMYHRRRLSITHSISGLSPKDKGASGTNVRSSMSSRSTHSGVSTSPPSTHIQHQLFSSHSLVTISSDLLLDHSHLKPGANAALLSYDRTINMYRDNAKKTNDSEIQYDFAMFLVEAAKRLEGGVLCSPVDEIATHHPGISTTTTTNDDDDIAIIKMHTPGTKSSAEAKMRLAYLLKAEKLLKQTALRGHSKSQYYLARMYAAGLLSKREEPEFDKAFPLFVLAAKHHDPDAAFHTAKCYEHGLGTKRDRSKALQFYKRAAALNHPGAMYQLGLAEMNGELGISRDLRDGHTWLKRSADAATPQYPHALHELGLLHEKGFDSIIFIDHAHAVRLYRDAAALNYAPSAFRLGECYEFGRLGCPIDPALSAKYYRIAAEQDHLEACFALSAWYLIGTPDLRPSEGQAFAWAYRAAVRGLPKAEFAIGYYYEVGIGIPKNIPIAILWFNRAAANGDKRAATHLHQAPASYRSTTAHLCLPTPPPQQQQQQQQQKKKKKRRASLISSRLSLLKSKSNQNPAPVVEADAQPAHAFHKKPVPLSNFV